MKKLFTACLLIIGIMARLLSASAEPFSLALLKARAPERLRLTVTTGAGETVTVDAPVVLPEADTMPILLVRSVEAPETFLDVLNSRFIMTKSFKQGLKYNTEFRAFNYECAPKGRTRIADGAGMARLFYRGRQPDNNDMPLKRPAEKVAELLALCGVEEDVRVTWQAATSMAYRCESSDEVKRTDRGDLYVESVLYTDQPGKGYEKGYYDLVLTQYLNGVPILEKAGAQCSMKIIDEDDFRLFLNLQQIERVVEPDCALAGWEAVEKAVAERIQSGVLHSVTRIELGYALRYENGDSCVAIRDVRHSLVPVWRVYGYDDSVQQLRAHVGYTNPTEDEMWPHETAFSLDMDARTAEWCGDGFYTACYPDFVNSAE